MSLSKGGRPIRIGLALFVVANGAVSAIAQNPAITVNVNVTANRRSISPYIYGLNYADSYLSVLNSPLHRLGGNNMSRYNWQLNSDNRGSDYYFESIPETSSTPSQKYSDFITGNKAAGAVSAVTIPMIGYVGKLGANRSKLASFSIAKYGAQQYSDYWFPDAGNGVRTNGTQITGNNPLDANVVSDVEYQRGFVNDLIAKFGKTINGGVALYLMDNEPSIWHSTHRDVHPVGATMDEVFGKIRDYAKMVKTQDPTAYVLGPEEWGWSGFFFSGYDQQYGGAHGWGYLPDRVAHGNMDYVPWLLQQLKAEQDRTGLRHLDVLSLHYYPQGGEYSDDVSTSMQLRRNRSTRSLWDPNYTDETWIGDKVKLIPRMKQWSAQYYPGTGTAITEYSWGADSSINGATAQADILGIFGREGIDLATRWVMPTVNSPTFNAFKMYRNYDGNKASFGDTSVSATVPNPDNVSAFASQDSGSGTVKVMVIAKVLSGSTPVTVSLANFTPKTTAQVYQLSALNVITRLPDASVSGNALTFSAPAQSITLFVIPKQ